MNENLGRRIWILSLSIKGRKSESEWEYFLNELVNVMDMNPCGEIAVWLYPVEGKGGNGMTMVRPVTESFFALDTWPDHGGVYLSINSCKPFDARQVVQFIEIDNDLVVVDTMGGSLGLPDDELQ